MKYLRSCKEIVYTYMWYNLCIYLLLSHARIRGFRYRMKGLLGDNKSDDIQPRSRDTCCKWNIVAQRRSCLIFSRNITYYAYVNIRGIARNKWPVWLNEHLAYSIVWRNIIGRSGTARRTPSLLPESDLLNLICRRKVTRAEKSYARGTHGWSINNDE